MMRGKARLRRVVAWALLLALAGCGDLYFGDNPAPAFPKQTGPLTEPPRTAL